MTNLNFAKWRKMGITVKFLFIAFSISAQNYITTVDENSISFSTEENQKIGKMQNNNAFEQVWVITLADLSTAENGDELIINLPDIPEEIKAFRKSLEVEAPNKFLWDGEIEDDGGSIFFNRTSIGLFGRITLDHDIYLIEAINEYYSLLMKMDTLVYTPEECGTPAPNPSDGFRPTDDEINERNHCEDLPIRVGVMFTQNAQATGLDMENIAMTAVQDLNRILLNSDVQPHDARFALAGVQLLVGFGEGVDACVDAVAIRTNLDVQAFRNDPGVLADVVVLLTNGAYGSVLGCVGDLAAIGATPENAFAIVQAAAANGRFTFAHEVVHLVGGRHQQCDVWESVGCDDTEGFAHGWGWTYRTCFICRERRRTTLMHQLRNGYNRRQRLSNPDIDGRVDLNDNARMMGLNACAVAGFAAANPMAVSFSEKPSYLMTLYSTGTWCVKVENCANVSISWAYSTDGWDYYTAGSTECITHEIISDDLWIRVTVTCAGGQTITLFSNHKGSQILPLIGGVGNQYELEDKLQKEGFIAFPNPASSGFFVTYLKNVEHESSVFLTDMQGRKTEITHRINEKPGIQKLHISTNNFQDGIYILTIINGEKVSSKKIQIHHARP